MKLVNDATFAAEVLAAEGPVLVDFYADWCAPCKALAPVLDALSGLYAGRAVFVKADIAQAPGLQAEFGVKALPTLIVFRDGKPAGQPLVGAKPRAAVTAWLDAALG
jgi:thioredoxin 1